MTPRMLDESQAWQPSSGDRPAPAWLARRIEARLRRMVAAMPHGHLLVVTPEGARIESDGRHPGPSAVLHLANWRAIRRLATHGDLGFAEGYIAGDWSTPDLGAVLGFALANRGTGAPMPGLSLARFADRLLHRLRRNSRAGSRRNIEAHYDLGNDFYAAWLDASMSYSSALYEWQGQTLEEAQAAKLDRIVEALQLSGGERVLEIGCGWGGLAEHLGRLGCQVTAITLSPAQHAYAVERVERAGLSERVEVRLQDYRDVCGAFDRIVSIEMIEAVGEAFWPDYFRVLHDRLQQGGRVVLQAITIEAGRFEAYRRRVDFIQRYVFPGGMLPSPEAISREFRSAGLQPDGAFAFGVSYADTLDEWSRRFQRAWPQLAKSGMTDPFRRLWEYYLAYCSIGFRAGTIDVGLFSAVRD